MPSVCYLDLDDYNSPDRRVLEALEWLRFYFPNFKINLLVSGGLPIPENEYPDKYAYLLHGWNHNHFDEVTDEQLESWDYDPIYRAPYWELSDDMYERLKMKGYRILVGLDDSREGIKYNWDIKNPPDLTKDVLMGHGHITPSVNYLPDCIDNILMLPKDTKFGFLRSL